MIFTQPRFFVFLFCVFVAHWSIQSNKNRKLWLLACSLFFYGMWNFRFIPILLGITFIDYFASLMIVGSSSPRRREIYLMMSLAANLTLLLIFKYFGFFVSSAISLVNQLGFSADPPLLEIVIPLGLSFHTFQAMAYTIDVYRGRARPAKSILDFALFVTFFPQLVAGPIVRANDFLPVLDTPRKIESVDFRRYLVLFLFGLFKKGCLSDNIATFIDRFYQDPNKYSSVGAWTAIILYSVQIYADFSGYTDMAIACSGLLGFNLPPNFQQPYLSRNIQEFWRRWHISMSQWFRDYVYIPLGGGRGSEFETSRNLILTSLVSGLWHGANWKFVFWGFLHGLSLLGHRWFVNARGSAQSTPLANVTGTLTTFLWVTLLWVFFRADHFSNALSVYARCFSFRWTGISLIDTRLAILIAYCTIAQFVFYRWSWERIFTQMRSELFYCVLGIAYAITFALMNNAYLPFIYFQF